jgi:hypothetical protein
MNVPTPVDFPRIPPSTQAEVRLAADLFDLKNGAVTISGDRAALESRLRSKLSDTAIVLLFGGIQGSAIKIKPDGKNVDVWTSNDWFESPLYFSMERDELGIILTINDLFLLANAPKTLGTRIVANMIFQAARIPGFYSIDASATRFYLPKDAENFKEVVGYYFFPRLGFNADPKYADEPIPIPARAKGKKLLSIMRDPDLRQWWKENGQTIDVRFKMSSQRSFEALTTYLIEKGITIDRPTESA